MQLQVRKFLKIKSVKLIGRVFLTGFIYLAFAATAGATFVLLGHTDTGIKSEISQPISSSNLISEKLKSHASEAAAVALFCTGIMGTVVRFIRKSYEKVKRVMDAALSVLALILLSPLCVFAILLIKLSSKGPVFFTQTRVGRDEALFEIYKFRTMKIDAEKETGPIWAAANDERFIPCGKFLRKAHIDEIPQFINVLRGEMSIVGPRPERPVFVDQFKKTICNYGKRICVKPGITGLAQVWHKYDETIKDVRKKVKYDLLYIKRICLWTDVQIMLRTVRVVFTGAGAH